MKKSAAAAWNGIGTTGKILIGCFLFYFIAKTLGKH